MNLFLRMPLKRQSQKLIDQKPLVVLAVLPGLILLPTATGNSPVMRALIVGAFFAPAVIGLIIAIARRSPAAFPVWGFLSAGYLGFAAAMLPAGLADLLDGLGPLRPVPPNG